MATLATTFNATDKATPGHYGPSETALLLLDFHSMFVHKAGAANAPAALEVAVKMRKWAKSQGIQVIHGLNNLDSMPYPTCKYSEMYASIVAAMRTSGSEEPAELVEDRGDDVTFRKDLGHVSALKSPGLEDFLQMKGIKSLIIAGLGTAGCVLTTALAASDAEYVVTVISDGCADQDDAVHDLIVGKLVDGRAYAITATEFQEGFVEARRGK